MKELPNFNLILFGSTGDLALHKLLPALFNAYSDGNIHQKAKIFALGRKDMTNDDYCNKAYSINQVDKAKWDNFCNIINYVKLDASNLNDYINLATKLPIDTINIYYLSTDPNLFKTICNNIANAKLNYQNSRIVLEKPLGHDLASSNDINSFVGQFFTEQQIYRIDHYLGKESVQNLMAIRFGNTLFEALWRRQWISSVQITIAEDVGVATRGEFYENTGALRDMLQNHLLQLLCIVAMEPPYKLDADVIRDEKLKVLKSLQPFNEQTVLENVVRGQYKAGIVAGSQVKGYLEENHVNPESQTETYVALKTEIKNWRWAGVPFYLRTGKRLAQKVAEIVIQFKDLPCNIFPNNTNNFANRLIIRLQPDEKIQLYFLAKKPGDANELSPVFLDLDFNKTFSKRRADGYERLLLDVIRGKLTLFVRHDEQMAAWEWVEPILNTWNTIKCTPKTYNAGSYGPSAASALLNRDNHSWHEELL